MSDSGLILNAGTGGATALIDTLGGGTVVTVSKIAHGGPGTATPVTAASRFPVNADGTVSIAGGIQGTVSVAGGIAGTVAVSSLPSVTVASAPAVTGTVGVGSGTITTLQNGTVVVSSLPSVTIGSMPSVTVSSLPNVTVATMPNVVGTVGVSSGTVNTGNAGTVGMLQAGTIDVLKSGTVTVTSLPNVTVSSLPSVTIAAQPNVQGTVGVSSGSVVVTQQTAGTIDVLKSGTVSVSNTVAVSGPLTDAQLRAANVPVSGTVGVSGTTLVSGTVVTTGGAAGAQYVVDAQVNLAGTGNIALAVRNDGGTALVGSDLDWTPLSTDQNGALRVTGAGGGALGTVAVSGGTISLSGTSLVHVTGGTSVVTGPLTDTQLRATPVPISDGSGSLTVDGTVNVAGTVPTTVTGTATVVLGTASYAEDAAHTSGDAGLFVLGVRNTAMTTQTNTDGDYSPISVDSAGRVNIVGGVGHDSPVNGLPVVVGGVASAAAPSDVSGDQDAVRLWALRNGALATQLTASGALITGDGTNGLDVDVTRLPALPAGSNNIGDVDVLTLPALPAGSNNIGDVDILSIAAGDNNIGNVDIVTMPAISGTVINGGGTIGLLQAGTVSMLSAGTVSMLSAGTVSMVNAGTIDMLKAGTVVVTSLPSISGTVINGGGTIGLLQAGTVTLSHGKTRAGTSVSLSATGTAIASPGAGTSIKVVTCNLTAAGTAGTCVVTLKNGTAVAAGTVGGPYNFVAGGGMSEQAPDIAWPLYLTAQGSSLCFDVTGGTVTGWITYYLEP